MIAADTLPRPGADPAIAVGGLRIVTADGARRVVDDASFEIAPGEILGVVGESGSGKTTLGLALLRHCRRGLAIDAGVIRIGGNDLRREDEDGLRRLRGRHVCYVPQDPATALNPALRIRTQLAECFGTAVGEAALLDLLDEVKLPRRPDFLDAFPHQLSGGQLQRVAIAMAFANRPRLIVMDEPTTGLDVTTQAHVLDTVRRLCAHHHVAAVYVSHDIAVVAAIADRVAVVYAGRIVEIGPTERVLHAPSHPYTRALIRAVPDLDDDRAVTGIPGRAPDRGAEDDRCSFAPRCVLAVEACRRTVPPPVAVSPSHEVRCLRSADRESEKARPLIAMQPAASPRSVVLEAKDLKAFYARAEILHGLTFEIGAGECVGLVGESGSGKTTLARCLAGLHDETAGAMTFAGEALPAGALRRSRETRRRIQYIFQNPYGSLNPRRPIGASIGLALRQFVQLPSRDRRRRVLAALDQVSLPASAIDRYPHELSGGQRQRAAIARALVAEPDVLVCDEITSALDVSVQAVITELLSDLQRERGLTLLFVTHNLAVVRGIAQRIFVMQSGRIVESGSTAEVLGHPVAAETRRMMRDAPRFSHPSRAAEPAP
ncbi:ABC transporter ATP-binding protein [Labrys monachus]|uniref:Peptide/nickel transport system ATP-binding protein n=1 Tax=Labrys monachus TaxID=217067 RepID=A0ABU0FBF7_9HYPH|nr:ABC transporter ATP-binding protein [Labrys monachus]MDQ0391945.1 peptide/nickel transport system ATP-binding protein [Labrys monachus]